MQALTLHQARAHKHPASITAGQSVFVPASRAALWHLSSNSLLVTDRVQQHLASRLTGAEQAEPSATSSCEATPCL